MPQLNEVRKGREIGYKNTRGKFIWVACCDCSEERWVKLIKGKPQYIRCNHCGSIHWGREHRRELSTNWRGGRLRDAASYIMLLIKLDDPIYPMANKMGYIREHRLVMARHLGRCLQPWEIVHHKNGIKDDNRLENLELTIKGSHSREHNRGYRDGYAQGYEDGKQTSEGTAYNN